MGSQKCKWCGENIGFENAEWGYDFCDACSEIEIERSDKRREWAGCHPGVACPEEELPPYSPTPSQEVSDA